MIVKWKWQHNGEPFEVEMDDEQYAEFCVMRDTVFALPEGEERSSLLGELCTLMELRAPGLDAHEIDARTMETKGLGFELLNVEEASHPLSDEARTETLAMMEKLESEHGFKIPDKAKRLMAEGQTSLLAEPRRMPYRDADEELTEPVLAGEAHTRSSDPWTSHAAARSISPDEMRETQMAVLDCLRRSGALHHEGLVEAYEAMRGSFGWPKQSVSGLRTRTSELVQAGLVQDSGRTVTLPSKRSSIVWEAVSDA